MLSIFVFLLALVLPLHNALYTRGCLQGTKAVRLNGMETIDFSSFLESQKGKTIVVLGTYAADFNMIEYAQRLSYYLPRLKQKDVSNFMMIVNGRPQAALHLSSLLDLPEEIDVLSDPTGSIGKQFGVSLGWRPNDHDMSPYLKLFGMLWGLGAWATLPSVIGGYIGNPFTPQPWIESALAQGQLAGRWPNNALDVDKSGTVLLNKFSELPVVGEWKRRCLCPLFFISNSTHSYHHYLLIDLLNSLLFDYKI